MIDKNDNLTAYFQPRFFVNVVKIRCSHIQYGKSCLSFEKVLLILRLEVITCDHPSPAAFKSDALNRMAGA